MASVAYGFAAAEQSLAESMAALKQSVDQQKEDTAKQLQQHKDDITKQLQQHKDEITKLIKDSAEDVKTAFSASIATEVKKEVKKEVPQQLPKELAPAKADAARAYNATVLAGHKLVPVPITEGDNAGTVPENLPATVFDLNRQSSDEVRATLDAYGVNDGNDRPRKRLAMVLGAHYYDS